ncbi:MAG: AI-2E family transporter, partial [Dehalococcoidia bacterium]
MLTLRRIRYGMVIAAVLIVAWLLWQARGALIPFVVGGVLAYVMSPLVERVAGVLPFHRTRQELARTVAVAIVYITGLGILVGAGALIIPAVINEADEFVDNIPSYVEEARREAERLTNRYRETVPPEIQTRIENSIRDLGNQLGQYGQQALSRTFGVLQGTFGLVFGYIIIPFWLFYILKDRHKIAPVIRNWFPSYLREDVDNCIRICQRVLGSYIRAQLTLGLFIGVVTTAGLFLLGVEFYVILGIIAGITELIPILGPILGAIPAIIVVLATEPEKTIWVVLFYIGVQQLENAVLVPRVQGSAVDMHPALIIVLLVIAQQVAGFTGMLVAVPLAAVTRDLFKYVYSRLQEREVEEAADRERVLHLPRGIHQPAGDAAPDAGNHTSSSTPQQDSSDGPTDSRRLLDEAPPRPAQGSRGRSPRPEGVGEPDGFP